MIYYNMVLLQMINFRQVKKRTLNNRVLLFVCERSFSSCCRDHICQYTAPKPMKPIMKSSKHYEMNLAAIDLSANL